MVWASNGDGISTLFPIWIRAPRDAPAVIESTNRFPHATAELRCSAANRIGRCRVHALMLLIAHRRIYWREARGKKMLTAVFELARPLLFALDPEQAHELTLKSLEAGIYPRPLAGRRPAPRSHRLGC